jgi:hypothetical protein
MTTSELIKELSAMPSDSIVMLWGPNDQFRKLESVEKAPIKPAQNAAEEIAVLLS